VLSVPIGQDGPGLSPIDRQRHAAGLLLSVSTGYRSTAAGAAARRSAANAGSVMLTRLNKYAAMPYAHCRALKDVAKQRLFRSIGCFGWTLTSLCLARQGRATCSIRRETEGSVAEAPCTQSRLEVAGKLSYNLQATRQSTSREDIS